MIRHRRKPNTFHVELLPRQSERVAHLARQLNIDEDAVIQTALDLLIAVAGNPESAAAANQTLAESRQHAAAHNAAKRKPQPAKTTVANLARRMATR